MSSCAVASNVTFNAVKQTTESWHYLGANQNLEVTFKSHLPFARKCKIMMMRFQNPLANIYSFINF